MMAPADPPAGRRLWSLAVAGCFALVLASAASPGCDGFFENDPRCSSSVGTRCLMNHVITCDEGATGTVSVTRDDDCGARHQLCVSAGPGTACVDPVPCAGSACDGSQRVICASGYLFSRLDCASTDATTCAVGANGPDCVYAQATCPASGAGAFCDPDGHTLWSGCAAALGHPTRRMDCADEGSVCASGNGVTECVLTQRIPCTRPHVFFCASDGSVTYDCGESGFAAGLLDCASQGRVCKPSSPAFCVYDIPCDATRQRAACSPDRSQVYQCQTDGWVSAIASCGSGTSCVEKTGDGGRTDASCVKM